MRGWKSRIGKFSEERAFRLRYILWWKWIGNPGKRKRQAEIQDGDNFGIFENQNKG